MVGTKAMRFLRARTPSDHSDIAAGSETTAMSVIRLTRGGEAAGAHVGGVGPEGALDLLAQLGVAAHEARLPDRIHAQQVVHHQDLPVAARSGADTDGGDGDGLG